MENLTNNNHSIDKAVSLVTLEVENLLIDCKSSGLKVTKSDLNGIIGGFTNRLGYSFENVQALENFKLCVLKTLKSKSSVLFKYVYTDVNERVLV